MQIFIINLEKDINRKEYMQNIFEKMNIKVNFFKAIDSSFGKFPLYYPEKISSYKTPLTKGELGCYASHYSLWEKCIELNEPIIILEDDAIIDQDKFIAFYNICSKLDSIFECIRLTKNRHKRFSSKYIHTVDTFEINLHSKGPIGAIGYYLTPKGANKFISNSQEWTKPVDDYMDQSWFNKVVSFGLNTPPILLQNEDFTSSIDQVSKRRKKKLFLINKLRKEICNLVNRVKEHIFYKKASNDLIEYFKNIS